MATEEIAGHVLITLFIHLAEKLRRLQFLQCRLIGRNSRIRVSFASLLSVQDGGRFLLIRNLRRPEAFAPLGGVFKYFPEAQSELDSVEFQPENVGPGDIMKRDLRGYLPRRYLPKLVKWFEERESRELAADTLVRELREELAEIALTIRVPDRLPVRLVRKVFEGPEKVPGQSYTQFRHLEIYALIPSSDTERLTAELIESAENHKNLLLATGAQILAGRADDGRLISHNSVYLIQRRRTRADVPPFVHSATTARN